MMAPQGLSGPARGMMGPPPIMSGAQNIQYNPQRPNTMMPPPPNMPPPQNMPPPSNIQPVGIRVP